MRLAALVLVLAGCSGPSVDADPGTPLPDAVAGDAGSEPDASVAGWRSEPPVPERIQEIAAAVHGGRLWIAGGFDGSLAIVPTVRVFDPATSTWSAGPELPAPRHH